jgi:hypothetical protein
MTTIETRAHVGPDRKLTIDVPDEVPEGEHDVVVWLKQDADTADEPNRECHLEWDNGLLIYTGPVPQGFDFQRALEESRDERLRQIGTGDDG